MVSGGWGGGGGGGGKIVSGSTEFCTFSSCPEAAAVDFMEHFLSLSIFFFEFIMGCFFFPVNLVGLKSLTFFFSFFFFMWYHVKGYAFPLREIKCRGCGRAFLGFLSVTTLGQLRHS